MDIHAALNILNQVAAAMMGNLADHQNVQKALEVVKAACFPPPVAIPDPAPPGGDS